MPRTRGRRQNGLAAADQERHRLEADAEAPRARHAEDIQAERQNGCRTEQERQRLEAEAEALRARQPRTSRLSARAG